MSDSKLIGVDLRPKDRELLKSLIKELSGIRNELERANTLSEIRVAIDAEWLRRNQEEEEYDNDSQTTFS